MNIQNITDGVISGINLTFRAIKSCVTWCGHRIQSGFTNYLVPTIKSLWATALTGFAKIAEFLKTPSGMAFASAVSLFVAGNYMIKLAQSDVYQDSPFTRTAITLLGLTAVAGAVFATAVGVSTSGIV